MHWLKRHKIFSLTLLLSLLVWSGLAVAPVQAVILWTDALIYLLILSLALFTDHIRNHPPLRDSWADVIRNRLAAASMVILLAYVVIGLLDSVHYRPALEQKSDSEQLYSVEVLSLLDQLTQTLREQQEKTYSAPMATHLFAKETIEQADGSQIRDSPRLKYGGAHLDELSDYSGNLLWLISKGVLLGLLLAALFIALTLFRLGKRQGQPLAVMARQVWSGEQLLPWNVILSTLTLLLVLLGIAIEIAPHYHLFGTDKVGQDVFYQALKSIRTGLVIGSLTTLVMLPFAIMLGIMAGYFGGWIDDVIQYIYTTLSSIPGVLLIAASVLMIQVYIANNPELFDNLAARADMRLLFLCIILGITSWTGLCRLLRGEALKLREADYIQASQAFGVSHFTIILKHILPNVMHIVLIAVVLDFSGLVLAEAVLSYVGVGVDPSTNSWGNMINGARLEMAREPMVWWSLLAAFILMFVLVLAANLFSDAVREAFDPRAKQQK